MERATSCNRTPVVGTRFGGERERLPSIAIIEAVAAAEGVTPTELDPMYGEINPESIDQLFSDQSDASKHLRFSVRGWTVFVHGDGAIQVCDPDRQADPAPVSEKSVSD